MIKDWFAKNRLVDESPKDISAWKEVDRLFRHKFAFVSVGEADTFLYLIMIEVDKKHRGKGIASSIVKRLVWYANHVGKDIVLEATDGMGSDLKRLFSLYEKHGFQKGKIKRIHYRHNMYYRAYPGKN
ncbi:GNAT family N-acetyltransferase (plasmid) [Paenibacillus thiaminolyticus]|uniref:GNAT family N-acetyltransferase n=1 Tax=Paenibacillus thiaminolyticus TaxID=49283 RepID=UPI00232E0D97|nr:GNAT family N-acetyltransferase [Paenibacillus thiaminolyticus]WCF11476.1 GNAT family N-acetyltransferase [Paenibacillus thiaminolyticus]